MKTLLIALLSIAVLPILAVRADAITPEDAATHVGESQTVTGVVVQVFTSKNSNVFLNFGAPYPKQVFAAVWFARSGPVPASFAGFDGKKVSVTGKIQLYQGKPEIILTSGDQIKAVE